MAERTDRIRELNDKFRTSLTGGKVYMTAGVDALGDELKRQALEAVKTFDRFSKDNDPWHEHDFGSFEVAGHTLFFKIDYFSTDDPDLGSEDPSDETKTERVLTVMLAEEY